MEGPARLPPSADPPGQTGPEMGEELNGMGSGMEEPRQRRQSLLRPIPRLGAPTLGRAMVLPGSESHPSFPGL